MSTAIAFDHAVTSVLPNLPISPTDDPLQRLFIDRALPGGLRLLALAEPVHRTAGGQLAAAAALAAFEEAITVAVKEGVESGLLRAFAAANTAVRAANHAVAAGQREYAGVTAVVMTENEGFIGCVPPGQALLLQDGRMYGVPDLATWSPVYMPQDGAPVQEPLGLATFVRPLLRRTEIQTGDQLVLGSSTVGRVMAKVDPSPDRIESDTPVVDSLEQAIEASGAGDAYAAWMRVAAAPAAVPTLSAARLAQIDTAWGKREITQPAPDCGSSIVDPRRRRAERRDRLHGRMIEVSERLLGGGEPEGLPFEAKRRASAPPGAASLERHVPRHGFSLGPSFRCRLPRGLRIQLTKRSLLALFVVLTLIVGAALGYDVRQARANKQDRFLNAARAELQRASAGGTEAEVEQHLVAAHRSLDNAAKNGADEEEIAQWRAQVAAVEDRLGNVHHIDVMSQIGALPSSLDGTQPQLVLAAGRLYLVANGVYAIDEANLSMVQILDDGDKFGRITAGRIVNATVDGADLLVTDGKALFRRPPEGRWSAERLASSAHLDGWVGAACGVYQGSFYLLETDESPQIKKFSTDAFDREPENWLSQEATGVIASGIDMAVARSIFVLTSDGKIHQFHRGDPDAEIELERISSESQFVGLDQGPATGDIFLVEANGEAARLTRVDPDSAKAVHYEPVEFGPPGSAEAAAAFAQTTDFVVDEATGIIYFLSPDGLWRGNLT